MARLAEHTDSDAEFPDLKDLLKGVKSKPTTVKTKAPPTRSGKGHASEEKRARNPQGVGVRSVRNVRDERNGKEVLDSENEGGEMAGEMVGERSVKKKRVLGKRDYNPLLRPISKSAREESVRGASSTIFDVDPEMGSKGKAVKARRIGERSTAKAATIEVEASSQEELGARLLKVKAMKHRLRRTATEKDESNLELEKDLYEPEPFSEVETVMGRGTEPKSRDKTQKEDKVFAARRAGQTRRLVTPETVNVEQEGDPEDLPDLEALKLSNSKSVSLENGSGSEIGIMKPENKTPTTGRPRSKAKPVTIDLVDDDSDILEAPEEFLELQVSKPGRRRDPPPRAKSKYILTDTEEEDEPEDEDDDGMSDFIVSDHESVEGDDSVVIISPPAPKSARKLVKGRRPLTSESDDEGLDLKMGRLRMDDDVFGNIGHISKKSEAEEEHASSIKFPTKGSRQAEPRTSGAMKSPQRKEKEALSPSSNVEDPFTLRFSPSENKRKVSKETRFTTPPGSPKLKPHSLTSPTKLPRIPTSPHRQSSDAFWSQDIVNDWNDEYSPRKTPKPTLKPLTTLSDGTLLFSPRKSPIKPDRLTKNAKKAFSQIKYELAESFFKELDDTITHGQIASMAEPTGGVKIIWSNKLNTTAGRANWKRETMRPKSVLLSSSSSSTSTTTSQATTYRHHAAIELASKVIDTQDRLLNVLAHEFCHLANFMVSNIRTNPHGKEFKSWAAKVSSRFGDRGIEVTTKHSYEIDYKYIWECENCGTEFKRHSKSIDPAKHRCGVCKYKLVQTKPVPKGGDGGVKVVTGYQQFVKENMKVVREENPGSPQKEIMGLVGKRYQEYKASKLRETSVESGSSQVISKESTPDDNVGDVVRKLDFLDLTSP